MNLIDDINRLFDELVRGPWSRGPALRAGGTRAASETQVVLEMPVAGGQLGDVSFSLHGRQLTVRARRRHFAPGHTDSAATEELERTLLLPETAEVRAIEARIIDEVLHVRVCLRNGGT